MLGNYNKKLKNKVKLLNFNNNIGLNLYLNYLVDIIGSYICHIYIYKNQINIYLQKGLGETQINLILKFLSFHVYTGYKQLVDITAVDYIYREKRFDIIYFLLSHKYKHRINIILAVDENTPVKTVSNIFSSGNWLEREVWDMFGIFFQAHPDLRRILTDYGFEGFPLRKDFPLTGYLDIHYDLEQKRIVYEPLEISQEFRYFDFLSPWEKIKVVY